ncbi:C10 family peptidase [Bacteroides muris (ex Fokt et al. 2023)]|uniref:C10 family peptidase n=1 Tax=Bacteroides muris (ex Fokt et al. 2023) TaxID=2937417 RepID=A0A9X2SSM3_9BACE|nr:C10 family peptidase [Bacteroides muris (ex Fokt et al. 2023)]MCR6504946.1 C10 family peptidase [Bacteroides muris (ex Fokt et al. 2023)]
MKKYLLSVFILLFTVSLHSREVTAMQASEMAVRYIGNRTSLQVSVLDVIGVGNGKSGCYIVNLAPQGWVVVSGDDVVSPIIAYSCTGHLDCKRIPENMMFMLDSYVAEVNRIATKVTEMHPQWRSYSWLQTRSSGGEIEPLIKVNWNQSAPYNIYCPGRGGEHAVVGCVAVAMGQAMSVHRYPSRPQGSVSYTASNYGGLSIDFDAERAYNWDEIVAGSNNYDEVARLLFHTGMSVRMDYGVDGSGIPSTDVNRISNALKNHFSYPEGVRYIWRDRYTDDWEQLLINELNAGRALVYNAIDSKNSSGHSFNIDGYDGEGHFHVNWGWGGYGNGNFSIDNLRDAAMQMDYDVSHVVIAGIGAANQVLKSISLSNNHIEEGLPAGAVVGQVFVNNDLPEVPYTVRVSGVNGKSVPFVIEDDMLKTTEPLKADSPKQWDIEITVSDEVSGTVLTQGFKIMVDAWKSLEETTSVNFDRTTRIFTFVTKHNVSYTLTDEQGRKLQSGKLEPLPQLQIEAASLPAGKNVLILRCVDEIKSVQLIK